MPQYSPTINIMMMAARKAARRLVRDFGEIQQLQSSRKGADSFAEQSDITSEKTIVEELKKARPSFGFLLEEGGVIEGTDKEFRWLVDPLDGTTNYQHGIPFFAISIALEKNFGTPQSEVVAGVIYAPIMGETYWAEKGAGSWLERDAGGLSNQDRLRVSSRKNKENALVMVSGFKHGGKTHHQRIIAMPDQTAGVRSMSCSALSLAYVAAGRCDAYFQTEEHAWDIGAGVILVLEAGGAVTTTSGKSDMLSCGDILATNNLLHKQFLALLE